MDRPERTDPHRHRWVGIDFYLEAGRPMLRQSCACGAERRLRAFERYWVPDSGAMRGDPVRGRRVSSR